MRTRRVKLIRAHIQEEDRGNAGVAVALAVLTVLAALVAGLEAQASIASSLAQREADRIGMAASGQQASAVLQAGEAYGVYASWLEELQRTTFAQNELVRDPSSPDLVELQTRAAADQRIAAWAKSQSPLLQPPYFNATTNVGDFAAFQADLINGPAALASEQQSAENNVAAAWQAKANTYVTILTILAVALFFVGLASTVRGRTARWLVGAGLCFGVVAGGLTVATALAVVGRIPVAAIQEVVAAEVAFARAPNVEGSGALTAAAQSDYTSAISDASQALASDPTYLSASLTRALAEVAYGDALVFSGSGPSDAATTELRGAIADYRTYLGGRPEDYAGWWNLGWAAYLVGDQPASIDATDRALLLSPGQFVLYLNRSLARLALGDAAGSRDDLDQALSLAAIDKSDTAEFYLGESDFDIGRLAELRPQEATTLLAMQLRLREAQVSLRVLGHPSPATDAPALGPVTLRAVALGRYAGGQLSPGSTILDGAHVATTDAVGVQVGVAATAGLAGRTLSARVWIDGLPRPEYSTDLTVRVGGAATFDLLSPYGRAGYNLDPGRYSLELYVDGARRAALEWTVDPRPSQPQYATTATPFVGKLGSLGDSCGAPVVANGSSTVACSATNAAGTTFTIRVTYDGHDRISYVVLNAASAPNAGIAIGPVGQAFFEQMIGILYPPQLAARASTWVREQDTAVNDLELGGTTLRVYGADADHRNLDIWSPWP